MKKLIHLLLICLTIILIFCSSCRSRVQVVDDDPIAKLQVKVPYVIVVPNYLPEDIQVYPCGISGPGINPNTETVEIGITYCGESTDKFIWIIEENRSVTTIPSDDSANYIVIDSISILEEPTELSGEKTEIFKGIFYTWNQNDMNFQVRIFGYEREKAIKVIESMIK